MHFCLTQTSFVREKEERERRIAEIEEMRKRVSREMLITRSLGAPPEPNF